MLSIASQKVLELAGRLERKEFAEKTAAEALAAVEALQAARAAKNVARREAVKSTRAARMEATKIRLAQQKAVKAAVGMSFKMVRKHAIADTKTAAAFAYSLYNEQFIKASRRQMMQQKEAVNILGLAASTRDGQMELVKQELSSTRLTRIDSTLLDVKEMVLPVGDVTETMPRATEDFMVVNYGEADADIVNIRKYVLLKVVHAGAHTQVYAAYIVKEDGKSVRRFMNVLTMKQVNESDIPMWFLKCCYGSWG